MSKNIYQQVIKNEYEFTTLFSEPIIGGGYIRYNDDNLRDKHDHNYSEIFNEFNENIFNEILTYKTERKEQHLKIVSHIKIPYLIDKKIEEGTTLTMMSEKLNIKPSKLSNLEFKNTKTNQEVINDILTIELNHYGKEYGYNFTARNIFRYFTASLRNNKLNLFACYYKDKIVGYCYAYYSFGVVGIDSLLVDESYRHNGIASHLISYIKNYYNCPIYLHADRDDTPKDLYLKIGFKSIYRIYEYFRLDEDAKIN